MGRRRMPALALPSRSAAPGLRAHAGGAPGPASTRRLAGFVSLELGACLKPASGARGKGN